MSRITKPGFFILAILLLGFASLCAKRLLVEVCNPTFQGERISLFEEMRKGEQLSRETQATAERSRIMKMVVEELMSGKMTLFETAAQFRSLYEEPRAWHHPDYPRPGHDDGEGWCRLVIAWAEKYVRSNYSPGRADVVCRGLERELREHLQRHGTVKLPDVTERAMGMRVAVPPLGE
jgi:hypothetical protein